MAKYYCMFLLQDRGGPGDTRSLPRRAGAGFRPARAPGLGREEPAPTTVETRQPGIFRRSGSVREGRTGREGSREPVVVSDSAASSHPIATKPRAFKRLLSRMRRANSGPIPQEVAGEAAAGSRASAGSQLGLAWNQQKGAVPFDCAVPFPEWDPDTICAWFDSMGLYMYCENVRKTVKTGAQLAGLSNSELETKLGITSFLHRKKVLLALMTRTQACEDPAGGLDHSWVTRWLDDVGLPQYKDTFTEARVDGRVLNLLTVEDLFQVTQC